MRYAYVIVEGPHDLEFVARFLKPHGLSRVTRLSKLDEYWIKLIPKQFPYEDDLARRMPVPVFFHGDNIAVAIGVAGGDSRIVSHLEETFAVLSERPSAIGMVLDADVDDTPRRRFDSILSDLTKLGLLASLPSDPGQVTSSAPRVGIFVLPDNVSQGTLESLLIECAALNYPALLAAASNFVGSVQPAAFAAKDMEEFVKNAGMAKATVSCVASVLKPGKAVQNSLQDNRWIHGRTLDLPRIAAFGGFIRELLGIAA
ncbi:MAG: DUF3226 domain-containing protein [Minicystis sp.]